MKLLNGFKKTKLILSKIIKLIFLKIISIFSKKEKGSKITKRHQELIKDFEKGKILQVDNKKNNKEYFKKLK